MNTLQQNRFFMKTIGILLACIMVFTGAVPAMAYGATDDEKAAAQEYIEKNFTNSKIITTGGSGVTQTGTTCTIGLKTSSTSTSMITSFRLKNASESDGYKSGWYVADQSLLDLGTKTWKPSSPGSVAFKRPNAEDGAKSFTATLKLFSSTTETSAIDDGTAEELASQDYTITILPLPGKYNVTFKPVDSVTKAAVKDPTVKLQKDWSDISKEADGSYLLEQDQTYSLTVTADGYKKYTDSSFQSTGSGEVEIPMTAIASSTIKFNITDKTGAVVDGASVKVKKGYYDTVNPQSDGSYLLENGTAYNYEITAKNYKTVSGSITPTENKTIDITLETDISDYKVTFKPVTSSDSTASVPGASIKVTYEEYDDYEEDFVTTEVKAESDGSYILNKSTTYSYEIKADGFRTATGQFKPSGDSVEIVKTIPMDADVVIDPADQAKVDAVKAAFDKEIGALRPDFAKDKNITAFVLSKIRGYSDIDTKDVTVALKTTGDTTYIKEDGTISYVNGALSQWGSNSKNISCTFIFRCNGAEAVSKDRTVTVCWDRDYFNTKMSEEKDSLTWDSIKAANTSQDDVTSALTLPQCMGTSARSVWSKITWESSDPSVIAIESTGYDSMVDPKSGKITPAENDTTVTLTATFNANDSALNTYVEKVSDFATFTKTFQVTVKGTGPVKPSEEELQAILDKYYTAADLQDFNTKETLDTSNVTGDIQLLRYTRVKDENGEDVFANKEIEVTSDNTDIVSVNAYRATVDRFAGKNDKENVNLIITFTRQGVTVSKKIPLTVNMITDAELDKEIAMMEKAKAHYFDGINNGRYPDKDSITGNLHAFREMTLDENGDPVWVYDIKDSTGKGIIPDDFFDDSWEMEGAGYNKFKSSNNAVIHHDNLVTTIPEYSRQITISSLLSSEKYGKFAKDHPDNEKLQKLYRQPVSVTVTVKGEKSGEEPAPEKFSVSFAMMGDTAHKEGEHKAYIQWIAAESSTVEEGTSVMDLTKTVLDKNGYKYTGASNYISSITSPDGTTLSGTGNGPNSGWMYRVNGKDGEVSADNYILKKGDTVLWYFTDDYDKEYVIGAESVSISKTSAKLTCGRTLQLTAEVAPAYADDRTVTWTSSDESIATVSKDGKVKALKAGNVTITASAGDKSASCSIRAVPASPAKFKARSSGTTSVKLTWGKAAGADKYKVYRATSARGTYKLVKTTSSLSTTDRKLTTGKNYYYKVRALGGRNFYSSYTAFAKVKPVPAKVTLKAKAGKRSATLSWTKVSGASGYKVYRATEKNGSYKRIYTTSKTKVVNKSLKKGRTYYYKVRAYKTVKGKKIYGAYSAVKTVRSK